jgi:type IV pilus assembly protein PilP
MRALFSLVPVSILVLVGCSTDRTAQPAPAPSQVETSAPTAAPPAMPTLTTPDTRELSSPVTSREGRDPFEPAQVVITPPIGPRPIDLHGRKSKRFGVEELKLIGIVSDSEQPRAMLVDPRGKGWVVTRGEFIGRPEIIHDREGDHRVSWRVDRIRESDVILVREDATHSVVPSSTRVLALRHEPAISDDAELDD